MAKRITQERVKKWAISAGIGGIPTLLLLILYLSVLGSIVIIGYSGDSICAGTIEDPCLAYVNFSVKEDIFLYPSDDWSSTAFYTDIQPKSVEMYRSWGNSWRKIDLSKGCTGSWCGCYWCTKTNTAVFSYAFREGREYQLKFVALKENPTDTIKWGFGPVDPFWYGINDTANISVSTSMNLELGTQVNISTNITGCDTVCVDIDHPDYGNNYTCGTPTANFLFNISYFREDELNDSSTAKNFTFDDLVIDFWYTPRGVTQNDTHYWITDRTFDDFFGYLLAGTYDYTCDTAASGNGYPGDMTNNDTDLWITDAQDDRIYHYLTDCTYVDYFAATDPYGVYTNNIFIWHVDINTTGGLITKHFMNGTEISNFTIQTPSNSPTAPWYGWALDGDDTYLYLLVLTGSTLEDNFIQKYYHNGTFVEEGATASLTYIGITIDDDYIRLLDYNDGELHAYNYDYERVYDRETFYIQSHQYAELINASLNLTGYNLSAVNIYVNNTLSNSIGELSDSAITLKSFGGSYSLTGELVPGTTGALDAGDCTGDGCAEFWDGSWATYATLTGGDNANITVNYTIPDYDIDYGKINFKAQASSSNDLFVYCWHNGAWIDAARASGYVLSGIDATANYTYTVAEECYEDKDVLQWKYEFLSVSYPFMSEFQWYQKAKQVEFADIGTEIFYINVTADSNVTSATCNVSGLVYENYLDQEALGDDNKIIINQQATTQISQRFKPAYANLSRIYVYVDHNWVADFGDLNVSVGTSPNSADIGSDVIDYNDVSEGTPDWEFIDLDVDLTIDNTYYITLNATYPSAGYGYRWYFDDVYESTYDRGGMTWLISGTPFNFTGDYAFRTYIDDFPENITMEVGDVDGTYEWNYTGEFTGEDAISDFSTEINDYLVNCTASNGYCAVPVYTTSITVGNLIFTDIAINYTVDSNPVYLDVDLISAFLNASSGFADIPIMIESDAASTIQVSDIRYDYAGGNDTIEVLTFNATDGADRSVNDTLDLIHYYSDWDYNFPTYINYLEFIPSSPTSKNVTPYGQTSNTPIFNITTYNYGGKNMNLSIRLDETSSNINLTYNSTGSSKPSGNVINTTWLDVGNSLEYLNNTQVWLWADYGYASPQLNWSWWFPNIYFRACCEDCICSEDLT